MRRTKEAAAITREHLLDAALQCFSTMGYSATTLDDIAKQAGTTRGAIHWHFGNKAELFNTLVRERYKRAATIFRDASATELSPLQQFQQLLIRWLSYTEEDPDFRTMLELVLLKTEMAPELAGGMQEKIQGNRFSLEYFTALIQKGIAAGEIRPEVNAQTSALAALGLVNGVTSLWLIDQTAFSLKDIAPEVVDLFLQGIIKT